MYSGAETFTVPNIVMNSLVSPTKVVTNDTIPNPIVTAHISLPSIPIPISSLGIPVVSMKTDHDDFSKPLDFDKMEEKPFFDGETIDAEDDPKLIDNKKLDEPMPVEEDSVIEMTAKIEENICETDIDVADAVSEILPAQKVGEPVVVNNQINKNGDIRITPDNLNSAEPMECVSVNSMASPKHTMAADVIMAESVSVT